MSDQLPPGEARQVGQTLYDQLRDDPTPPPDVLLAESYQFLGDEDIPYAVYTSTAYEQAEYDEMWPKVWQWACHVDHIPQPGDYYVYDVGAHSALIVRGDDGKIRAYYNACMHRGTQLKPAGSCGFSKSLRCPFHGWNWALDGTIVEIPGRWDFPHVSDESHQLPQMSVDTWQGFVFVNFDPQAAPLVEWLGVMTEHWADWGLEDRYIDTHVRKRLPCNWKAAAEAFLEAYHVRETHSTGKLGDEVTAAYDIFGDNVSRFIHTTMLNSPLRNPPRTEAELLARQSSRRGTTSAELPEGMRARDVYADMIRGQMSERFGQDYSHLSECMTLDSIDHSYFDLLMMRPRPVEGKTPYPPEVIELDVDDSYSIAEGLGGLGRVYDEDTANMAAQTRGFRASHKRGQTLGNYQEVRARHLQQRVRDYVGPYPTI